MCITDLYQLAVFIHGNDAAVAEKWRANLLASLSSGAAELTEASFPQLLAALAAVTAYDGFRPAQPVIAYGAGNMAKEHLPVLLRGTAVLELWDAYSTDDSLYGIPIRRPRSFSGPVDTPILVFIDQSRIRAEVFQTLIGLGFGRVYYFRDYLRLLAAVDALPSLEERVTPKTRALLAAFAEQYAPLRNDTPPVLFSALPRALGDQPLRLNGGSGSVVALRRLLTGALRFGDANPDGKIQAVQCLAETQATDIFSFASNLEYGLRDLLADGVKTRARPIRMLDDTPYDPFAVFTALRDILKILCADAEKSVELLEQLRPLSHDQIPLIAAECWFLRSSGQLESALELSRVGMHKAPNALLANECFYQTARACLAHGIAVEEPIPTYDLRERYCWSGMTFALCMGFDRNTGTPQFLPCFRTLQCAAYPAGDFWTGEEWELFRESLLDGSFRYCQKNQCTNLVAGWLPKKQDCTHPSVKRRIHGETDNVLPLEELHLSYDSHCNLCCPSCRLEIKTNSPAETEILDQRYQEHLAPLVGQAKHLCLSGCGEAIISPHSKKILRSLSPETHPGLAVELRSNVFSLNERTWAALGTGRAVIRHVAASIDAAEKNLFERLRDPAKWEIVLKNLEFLQRLRDQGELDLLEFHVVVQESNLEQLTDIIHLARSFSADVVTFSRLNNWRGMSEAEYDQINPFWQNHPKHGRLLEVTAEIARLQRELSHPVSGKKMYINMHFCPDPDSSYSEIRAGRLKVR